MFFIRFPKSSDKKRNLPKNINKDLSQGQEESMADVQPVAFIVALVTFDCGFEINII